jgi:dehydrogenase/reductase SDR family protein 1
MPARLTGKVALVTGASRGIGKGVALGLGEEGCTVYVTGKTLRNGDSNRPGSVTATAEEVSKFGGRGIAVVCDHHVDSQTEAVFQRVQKEQDRLDILVNNATSYSTDIGPPEDHPFWESALQDWDEMNAVGLRSHYVASIFAARMMIPQRRGLIVNISSMGAIKYSGSVSYNVVKAGVDMLTMGTAEELRLHNVAVVSLWPRLTKTEGVLAHPDVFPDLSKAWSPIFNGRAVVALASDPEIMERTGRAFKVDVLAGEYGFQDIDGRRPISESVKAPI